MSEETVRSLLADYPTARIARQLSWLPHRNAKNPAGLLVRAIRGDWSPPPAATETQRAQDPQALDRPVVKRVERRQPVQSVDETRAKLEHAKAEHAREKQRQARLVALEHRLSRTERDALRKQAEATVRRHLKAAWPKRRPIPKTFLDAEYYRLIEQRFGKASRNG